METVLFIIFFLSCIVLVLSVLLQPGKTDAGALFTSGVSSAAMNPRGTASVLSKLTIAAAATFMISALLLSLPAITGNVSVLDTQGETTTSSGAANTNANSNAANVEGANTADSNANSNAASNSESNSSETKSDDKKPEEKSDAKTGEKDEPKSDESKTDEKSDDKSDEKSDTKADEKKEDSK